MVTESDYEYCVDTDSEDIHNNIQLQAQKNYNFLEAQPS